MKLGDIGEFGLIDRISKNCMVREAGVILGIGDDCAVLSGFGGQYQLITTDLLIERVHFLRHAISPFQLGAKAISVNISDIAAMGGTPRDAFISIAVPDDLAVEYMDELYSGMKSVAGGFGVNILGGDTTGSKSDLVINIALTGEVEEGRALFRHGAAIGDAVYVTGPLGDSAAGLDAILKGRQEQSAGSAELARRHNEPSPQVGHGRAIARTGLCRAMIDISDGLTSDLGHICDRSGVGAQIEAARLPLSNELVTYCRANGLDPLDMAIRGGEDYVLLLTADEGLPAALGDAVPLHAIGRIVEPGRRELIMPDGSRVPLKARGWDHFAG